MTGLTAIITGGSSGIGLATARLFLENHAQVVLIGRQLSKLNHAAEILGSPDRLFTIAGDVSSEGYANKMILDTKKRFGAVNILVNCAGVFSGGSILKMTEEDFDFNMGVNLKGTWFMCKFAARAMLQSSAKGAIVNIASTLATSGVKSMPSCVYSASKGGVIALTNALSVELAYDVRVNCVIPGFVDSPICELMESLRQRQSDETQGARRLTKEADETLAALSTSAGGAVIASTLLKPGTDLPKRKLPSVDDVAKAIFALSDPASTWVSGEKIVVGDMES